MRLHIQRFSFLSTANQSIASNTLSLILVTAGTRHPSDVGLNGPGQPELASLGARDATLPLAACFFVLNVVLWALYTDSFDPATPSHDLRRRASLASHRFSYALRQVVHGLSAVLDGLFLAASGVFDASLEVGLLGYVLVRWFVCQSVYVLHAAVLEGARHVCSSVSRSLASVRIGCWNILSAFFAAFPSRWTYADGFGKVYAGMLEAMSKYLRVVQFAENGPPPRLLITDGSVAKQSSPVVSRSDPMVTAASAEHAVPVSVRIVEVQDADGMVPPEAYDFVPPPPNLRCEIAVNIEGVQHRFEMPLPYGEMPYYVDAEATLPSFAFIEELESIEGINPKVAGDIEDEDGEDEDDGDYDDDETDDDDGTDVEDTQIGRTNVIDVNRLCEPAAGGDKNGLQATLTPNRCQELVLWSASTGSLSTGSFKSQTSIPSATNYPEFIFTTALRDFLARCAPSTTSSAPVPDSEFIFTTALCNFLAGCAPSTTSSPLTPSIVRNPSLRGMVQGPPEAGPSSLSPIAADDDDKVGDDSEAPVVKKKHKRGGKKVPTCVRRARRRARMAAEAAALAAAEGDAQASGSGERTTETQQTDTTTVVSGVNLPATTSVCEESNDAPLEDVVSFGADGTDMPVVQPQASCVQAPGPIVETDDQTQCTAHVPAPTSCTASQAFVRMAVLTPPESARTRPVTVEAIRFVAPTSSATWGPSMFFTASPSTPQDTRSELHMPPIYQDMRVFAMRNAAARAVVKNAGYADRCHRDPHATRAVRHSYDLLAAVAEAAAEEAAGALAMEVAAKVLDGEFDM